MLHTKNLGSSAVTRTLAIANRLCISYAHNVATIGHQNDLWRSIKITRNVMFDRAHMISYYHSTVTMAYYLPHTASKKCKMYIPNLYSTPLSEFCEDV